MDRMLSAIETRFCHCIISIRAFLKFIKKWDKFEKRLRTENGYDSHYYAIEDEMDVLDLMFRNKIIPEKRRRQLPYVSPLFIKKMVRMYFYFNTLMKSYYKSVVDDVEGESIFNYKYESVYKFHKKINFANLVPIRKIQPFEINAPLVNGLCEYINDVFKIDYNVVFKRHFNRVEVELSRDFLAVINYAHKSAICFAEAYEAFDEFCFATGEMNIVRNPTVVFHNTSILCPFEFNGAEIDKEAVMLKLESIMRIFGDDKSAHLNIALMGADNALMIADEIQGKPKSSEYQSIDVCIMLLEHKTRSPWY